MSRWKVGHRPVMDTTLLSTSAIGSPAAFSTAIKPPGTFSTQPSSADSSLVVQQPHNHTHLSGDPAGQLSLSLASEAPPTEGVASDDTSLGILDLDNIQESSMSVFLTSPRTSHDLHNLMATHPPGHTPPISHPFPPTTSPLPSMGALRLSEAHTSPTLGNGRPDLFHEQREPMHRESASASATAEPLGNSLLADQREEGEGELSLPQDLLERSSSVSSGSGEESELETQSDGEDEQGSEEKEENESAPQLLSPPSHVRQSGDGHEVGVTRLLGQGPPQSSVTFSVPDIEKNGRGFSVAEILQAAERDGKNLESNDIFTASVTDTLIRDQEEPSLMREAAEFSRFEPDQLTTVMDRDSLLRGASSGGQQALNNLLGGGDNGGQPGEGEEGNEEYSAMNTSPEGLPSAYLQPSSLYSSNSGTPSQSISHTPSLTHSPSPSPSPPPHTQAGRKGRDKGREEGGHKKKRTSYNPFDSEDAASVEEMGEEEFGTGLDSGSFLAHLAADEAAVHEANKLMLPASFTVTTPHSTQFSLSSTQSGEKELSIGTYFGQRSYKLGALQSLGVASNERPHFSSPPSGLVQSPPTPLKENAAVKSQSTPPTPQTSSDPVDTTLLATPDESITEKSPRTQKTQTSSHTLMTHLQQGTEFKAQTHSLPSQLSSEAVPVSRASTAPHTHDQVTEVTSTLPAQTQVHATTSSVSSSSIQRKRQYSGEGNMDQEQVTAGQLVSAEALVNRVKVSAESLTPIVMAHTPFSMHFQIPRLDLSGLSKTIDTTPTTQTSTSLKMNPPTLSAQFKHLPTTTTHPLTHTCTIHTTIPPVTGIGSSPVLMTTAAQVPVPGASSGSAPSPVMEYGLQQSGLDSGLSSSIELKLASQYWKPTSGSSTLFFPELSATTLSPPPTEIDGLSSMPTPSMAHLSGGFNTTSQDGSFLQSLLGSLPTTSPSQLEQSSKLPRPSPATGIRIAPEAVVTTPSAITTQESHKQSLSSEQTSPQLISSLTTGTKEKLTPHSPPKSSVSPSRLPISTQSLVSSASLSTTIPATPQTPTGESASAEKITTKRPLSPKTEDAKRKLTKLKATLDSTEFDAAAYLSSLRKERQDTVTQPPGTGATSEIITSVAVSEPTVAKQNTSVPSQSPTVANQSTTVASQSPIVANQSTTVASQTANQTATAVSQITNQPTNASFSAANTSTASNIFLQLSPSPQKSPQQPSNSPPSVTTTTRTPAVSTSRKQPSTSPSHDKVTPQPKGGVALKTKKHDRHVSLQGTEQQKHTQHVAVRDIGVGTTPGLRVIQTRSSTRATVHNVEETTVSSSAVPVTTAQLSHLSITSQSPTHAVLHGKSSKSPTSSPQKPSVVPSRSPLSPPASSAASSRQEHSPSRPIYTSPRLHPHTSPLSPPPQLHSQPLTYRERRKTPELNALKVPDSLYFKSPCCVGVTLSDQLEITNIGDRWLQLSFELSQLYCNGQTTETASFSFPQRCFVSPRKTESIKVTFAPKEAGNYEALLTCRASLVISSENDSNCLSENVVIKALAVPPKLEVSTSPKSGETMLDYGILVSGSSLSLPLYLTNHGTSSLPLRLAISAPTLSQLYFSFEDLHPSLKPAPSSPSSYLHTRPFSTILVLPPNPQDKSKEPDINSVHVNFKSPKNFVDDVSPLGPPEEIKAQVNISVEGPNSSGILCSVPIRATVGVACLHVPRSLQALSLSCVEKRSVSRNVPFKNAGNISLQVTLKFSANCDHFQVTPTSLQLSPSEESQVNVSFSPPSSPLVIDGYLMIHVEPNGPNYELKLRGTATKEDNLEVGNKNLLFCNKRQLYWGSVDLRNSIEQKMVLQNSSSSAVPLQLSIRHQNQAFQLCSDSPSDSWGHTVNLPEQGQIQVQILFTPPTKAVFRNALDIYDTVHSKKFRIPLCGYGGTSLVEVVNARHSTSTGMWVDLGPVVPKHHSTVTLSLYNSGVRAAFVKGLCFPLEDGENILPLPLTQASVSPPEFVLHPQQMQELSVVYQPSREEVAKCSEMSAPLARLVLLNGDEIVRQRFQRAMAGGGAGKEHAEHGQGVDHQLSRPLNEAFLQRFPGQESVQSELDFSFFEVENEEKFFEQHIQQITVTLLGSPMTETPIPKKIHQPLSTSFDSPPKALHTLSPSHSLLQTTPPSHAHLATPSSHITSSHTLILPDSVVGQYSEKMLDVHNPYSQPLHWQLTSVASPFVRDTVTSASDICKANYSAFWVHERRGTVLPHSTSQVQVKFQPHDIGSFSQIWDLQVSCREIESGSKKIRLSFGGRAISGEQVKIQRGPTSVPAPRVHFAHPAPRSLSPIPPAAPHHTLTKRTVYIKGEAVEFPSTKVGSESILKVKVCNRDSCQHQFQVISLSLPFSVDHHSFELGSRQCARLPVHFSPSQPGLYEGVLAIKTATGHQAFSQLTGLAITHDTT